jgi:hypothetical protein
VIVLVFKRECYINNSYSRILDEGCRPK